MLYDTADHSYLNLDRQALLERHARFDEEIDREKVKEAQDRLRSRDD